MKITIVFMSDADDSDDHKKLDGKTVEMSNIDHFHINSMVDVFRYTDERGIIRREPMDTGSINLTAHGDRAEWKDGKETEAT